MFIEETAHKQPLEGAGCLSVTFITLAEAFGGTMKTSFYQEKPLVLFFFPLDDLMLIRIKLPLGC